MYIKRFEVSNYKSFYRATALELTPGFNIIAGQNNAGKTALLEVLSLVIQHKPHRSRHTIPTAASQPSARCIVDVQLSVSREELVEAIVVPDSEFYLPLPPLGTDVPTFGRFEEADIDKFKDWVLSRDTYTFHITIQRDSTGEYFIPNPPFFGLCPVQRLGATDLHCARYKVLPDKTFTILSISGVSEQAEIEVAALQRLRARIYSFSAQRYNLGKYQFGNSSELASNASNLASVLGLLQGNPSRFKRFNEHVRRIFPQLQAVSVQADKHENNVQKILVWTEDPEDEREDLAVPLDESGTGIGQVLAILYVVLTSTSPRIIIIDEPQSFLHPGAVRNLMEVLKQYSQHQFILATHSPTIINAANPRTITLVSQQGTESTLQTIEVGKTEELRRYLAEIGASLADVFGAQRILWVEGATEELAFGLVVERILKKPLAGTIIKGIVNTGDLEARRSELIFEIYDRLSSGASLLPPAIGFLLDDEGRSEATKQGLRKRAKAPLWFTSRRMFENYLLDPEAITLVLNQLDPDRPGGTISPTQVQSWLDSNGRHTKYGKPRADHESDQWARYVRADMLLKDLFNDLSDTRVSYVKTVHSVALAEWMIDNKPDALKDIVDLLRTALK